MLHRLLLQDDQVLLNGIRTKSGEGCLVCCTKPWLLDRRHDCGTRQRAHRRHTRHIECLVELFELAKLISAFLGHLNRVTVIGDRLFLHLEDRGVAVHFVQLLLHLVLVAQTLQRLLVLHVVFLGG